MSLEAIKKLLTETVGADESTKVVEALEAFQAKAITEAEKTVKARVTEGVKAEKIKLEASYLTKIEEAKTVGDANIKAELTKYEKQLAERVKHILTQAIDTHGDRLLRVAEQTEAKRGSALLEEVEKLISKGKSEITEGQKTDPKEVEALKTKITTMETEVSVAKRAVLEQKARANVAEQTVKDLRESLETSIQVTVEESERTVGKPAGEEHHHSKENVITEQQDQPQQRYSPEMTRMRRMAGIK